MSTLVLVIFIVLLGSAVFSCSEAALFSIPVSKVKVLVSQKKKGSKALSYIKDNIRRPIAVIVILNNAFQIAGSILVGVIAGKTFGNAFVGFISAVMTFLVIIFGEIIPKSIGENYSEKISLLIATPLLFLTKIFTPIVWSLEKITQPFIKKGKIVSEEEIKIMSHLGRLEGSIEEDEQEMIQNVFRLNDIIVKDIMTPRTILEALDGESKLKEVEEKIYTFKHSRLPVYKGNLDNITGVVHLRNLLTSLAKDEKEIKVKELQEKPIFVSEKTRVDILLKFLQKGRCHLAVVKDEFGGTSGIVTLEDVLEQLVGEITDETDEEIDLREKAKNIWKQRLDKIR